MRLIIALLFLFTIVGARYEVYNGYSTYRVVVKDTRQLAEVNGIEGQLALDVWSPALPGRPGIVFVPGEKAGSFEEALYHAGVRYKKEVENITELLDLESTLLNLHPDKDRSNVVLADPPFDRIYDYNMITEHIEKLAKKYPNLVKIKTAGTTFEGRPIKYLKISTTDFKDHSKPIVYLQSLLHAREWITSPASLYAIHKLVVDVTESDVQKNVDWIILPVVNPDGYMATHNNLRFWRKNRSTAFSDECPGVDLNRNFDVNWGEYPSTNECEPSFQGGFPFSELETQAIRKILERYKKRTKLFVDLHSFGSKILYAFGNGTLPVNGKDIHNVGVVMANAIDGLKLDDYPKYEVGNSAKVLYESSGTAKDYASFIGIPFAYTIEMPEYKYGRRRSMTGFLVDQEYIKQAGKETWAGMLAAVHQITKKY